MHHGRISRVSILGCGWLGFPLAKLLSLKGYQVKGSTTSRAKVGMLEEAGIDPYLVQFGSEEKPDLSGFLATDVLIVLIPPGKRVSGGYENYVQMIEQLREQLKYSDIRKTVFASSTSVYADTSGPVTESCEDFAGTELAERLLQAERAIGSAGVEVSIIRLAGLIGPGRHPGRFFAGRQDVPSGLSPINLIHLQDAMGIIEALIRTESSAGVWNASAPEHPCKMDFYTRAAASIGLIPPTFIEELGSTKVIASERIQKLTYEFQYPDLLKWLDSAS